MLILTVLELNTFQKKSKNLLINPQLQQTFFGIRDNDSVICGYFCIRFIDFMLAGKTLTNFTNLFSPGNLKKKWWYNFIVFYDQCSKMVECNSIETPDTYPNLNDQQQFRLNKINESEYYFAPEIKEKQLMSHRLND